MSKDQWIPLPFDIFRRIFRFRDGTLIFRVAALDELSQVANESLIALAINTRTVEILPKFCLYLFVGMRFDGNLSNLLFDHFLTQAPKP